MPLFPIQYLLLDSTSPAAVAVMFSVASCKVKLMIKVMEVNLAVISLMQVSAPVICSFA